MKVFAAKESVYIAALQAILEPGDTVREGHPALKGNESSFEVCDSKTALYEVVSALTRSQARHSAAKTKAV